MRDSADRLDLAARRVRLGVGDVLGNRPVEQEVVLQHHAEMRSIVAQLDARQVVAVHEHAPRQRPVERHHQADQRALARSARADERRRRSGRRHERDALEHRNAVVVLERHVVEGDLAADVRQRRARRVLFVLGRHPADLADAIEARERLAQLRPDGRELDHGHRHQRGEREIHHEIPDRHRSVPDRGAADQHHRDARGADDDRGKRRHGGHAGQRFGDVAEKPVRTFGEDQLFALLGGVRLDDADAAERFGEAAGDLGVDLPALAEQRPQPIEGRRHPAAEQAEDDDGHERQLPVQVQQDAERQQGSDDRSGELHEPGADEVPDAFRVGHDARNQDAALRRVEVPNRQAHHVRLDVLAHLGDGALRRHAEHLGVGERRERVDRGREAGGKRQLRQQIPVAFADHVVHQVFRRRRQHEAGQPVDQHQHEAEREPLAVDPDQCARFFPRAGGKRRFLRLIWGFRASSLSSGVRLELDATRAGYSSRYPFSMRHGPIIRRVFGSPAYPNG